MKNIIDNGYDEKQFLKNYNFFDIRSLFVQPF